MSSIHQADAGLDLKVPIVENIASDDADMRRLGKSQDFKRNFGLLSITAFTVIAIGGWVAVPSVVSIVLANGGTAGCIVMFWVDFVGLFFVVLTLAEMSSIAPTAGGQYHWVSEFAPGNLQNAASYMAGWMSTISWLSGLASATFLIGSQIQSLILLTNPGYVPKSWHQYLITVSLTTLELLVNLFMSKQLPKIEIVAFVLSILSFIAIAVVIGVLSPHLTATEVFQTFQSNNNWPSTGLGMLASQSSLLYIISGSDCTVHMAEETRNASTTIPKAMVFSYLINALMVFAMLLTYSFALVDYSSVVQSPEGRIGMPFTRIFANSTGSVAGGAVLASLIVVLGVLGVTTWMASCARQIWAFARDHGLPCAGYITKLSRGRTHPVNALFVVWAFVVLICLIALGSSIAFNAITSVQLLAIVATYLVSISCLLWRRFFGKPLPTSPWRLGRAAVPVNMLACCFSIYLLIFLPFPVVVPVTAENFNWGPVIFVGVMFFSLVYYQIWAKKKYCGPVALVQPEMY